MDMGNYASIIKLSKRILHVYCLTWNYKIFNHNNRVFSIVPNCPRNLKLRVNSALKMYPYLSENEDLLFLS